MDPATIIQIIGTALSLGEVVVKSITKLSSIKARYQGAPMVDKTMIGQLYIVQSALDQLGVLSRPELSQSPRHHHLAQQVGNSLDCFGALILALGEHLDQFQVSETANMTVKDRIAFLWSEKDMLDYSALLDRQVNALTLLLQAMQCLSWQQQYELMCKDESVETLRLAKDCSSSIAGIDDSSIGSNYENSDLISVRFDFDKIILQSRIYQEVQRSRLRQSIRVSKIETSKPPPMPSYTADMVLQQLPKLFDAETRINRNINTSRTNHDALRHSDPSQSAWQRGKSRLSGWWKKPPMRWTIAVDDDSFGKSAAKSVIPKVVMLGVSEGGKSTVLKAINFQLTSSTSSDSLHGFRDIIWSNIVRSTRSVLEAMESLQIPLETSRLVWQARLILVQPSTFDYTPHSIVCQAIELLWKDLGFQRTYRQRSQYEVLDVAAYFAKDIRRIVAPGYQPTKQDVIHASLPTKGVLEVDVSFKGVNYKFFDLGGALSERKHWALTFDAAAAIIFTIDVSSYAKTPSKDKKFDSIQQQLILFATIINSSWSRGSSFIIVFTKCDHLEQWFRTNPVEDYFPDFNPIVGSTVDQYIQYLELKLRDLLPWDGRGERCRFLRAGFDDIDSHNPAKEILETLYELAPGYHNQL